MDFTVFICFLVTTLTSCSTQTHSEVRYECGPHGTFQYCVEDDPGCVIGCHCHPGYYFDTETKICEPNTKLTHHSRRYLTDNREYGLPAPPTPTTPFPTPTATSYANNVEVQKDTDELSDWLYNQFFKTIENQVINKSNVVNSNSDAKPLTRRSASGGPVFKNKKKKARKSIRGRRRRKHKRRRGLKHKLLRITEDDSLFDSESGSDYSDSDDDYSDESYSDSEDASDTDASNEKETPGTEGSSDKDHGHKKVIVFNRRPKPPLPSFIFVPNMDTPYYPPIGLPPPPLLPMYPMPVVPPPPPMIPIPPPPLIIPLPPMETTRSPPPAPSQNNSTTQSNNDTTTTSTTKSTSTSTGYSTEDPETPKTRSGRRDRLEKLRKKSDLEKFLGGDDESGKQKNLKLGPKLRLMQKLMEKMKIRRRNNSLAPVESLDEFQDQDYQNDDVLSSLEYSPQKPSPKKTKNDQDLEDVDFKYLTELIHTVSKTTATRRPPSPFDLNHDSLPQPSRRNFRSGRPHQQTFRPSSDDIYYSNLGRQMASMVRNAETEGYPQFNKNIEIRNRQIPFHSVLKENNPRSFWERSVRSLQPQRGHAFEYLDETRTLRHSNEKGLINLENEVEIVASTSPPLSLQELENILSTMKKAHALIDSHPKTSAKQANVSLNINLLPKHVKYTSLHDTLYFAPERVEYRTQAPRIQLETTAAVVANNTKHFHEPKQKYDMPFMDYWTHNIKVKQHESKSRPKLVLAETRKLMPDNQTYNTNPVGEKFVDVVKPTPTEATISRQHYLQFLNNVPFTKEKVPKSHEAKVVKYKSFNNFLVSKHTLHESVAYPLILPFKSQLSRRANKPSYFHRHSHHFEFFN